MIRVTQPKLPTTRGGADAPSWPSTAILNWRLFAPALGTRAWLGDYWLRGDGFRGELRSPGAAR